MKLRQHLAIILLAKIACTPWALAQTGSLLSSNLPSRAGTAHGQLTVTLTVVTSVGVVIDEHGQPRIIVANAPDPADNVSTLHAVSSVESQQKQKNRKTKRNW